MVTRAAVAFSYRTGWLRSPTHEAETRSAQHQRSHLIAAETRLRLAVSLLTDSAASAGSLLEDLFCDDELHDLAGPLVDLSDLRVAVVALGWEVFQVSIPAEDLHAVP